jgi:hypothetical protein
MQFEKSPWTKLDTTGREFTMVLMLRNRIQCFCNMSSVFPVDTKHCFLLELDWKFLLIDRTLTTPKIASEERVHLMALFFQ